MNNYNPSTLSAAISAEQWAWFNSTDMLAKAANPASMATAVAEIKPVRAEGEPGQIMHMGEGSHAVAIQIKGPIFSEPNIFMAFFGGTALSDVRERLLALEDDPTVSTVIMIGDTPGGTVTGLTDTAEVMQAMTTPIIFYAQGMTASAGYWLASQADTIVANPTSTIGSIGVISGILPADEDGSVRIVSSQSPNKDLRPSDATSIAQVQRTVDELADVFIDAVASGRRVSRETVLSDFGQGGVLVGERAVEVGMADSVGTLGDVLALARERKRNVFMSGQPNVAPQMTAEYIAANHPDVVQKLITDEKAKIEAQAATDAKSAAETAAASASAAEATRIKDVLALAKPGNFETVNKLAFDDRASPDEAAAHLYRAELAAGNTVVTAQIADAQALEGVPQPSAPAPVPATPAPNAAAPQEERFKAAWAANAKLSDGAQVQEVYDNYEQFAADQGAEERIEGKPLIFATQGA